MEIRKKTLLSCFGLILMMSNCKNEPKEKPVKKLEVEIYETSASGKKLEKVSDNYSEGDTVTIKLLPDEKFQTITGFGGSFTESSAYLLNALSREKRNQVIEAYFGEDGARYSLTRTHMNSCDFSLSNYSYAPIPGDTQLKRFSIEEDKNDLIPMIKDAMNVSEEGFKILSSPWTAPPWMKDNNSYVGGKLLPKYYDTWALFFSKYLQAYKAEGIDIWGFTVENEPLGNSNNWDSMHFTAAEMTNFVKNHLGPRLEQDAPNVKILGYDQNRDEELKHWVDVMYENNESSKYFDGTAVHWYASTFDYFPNALQYAHSKAPNKHLIQSEACVDSEIPKWKNDDWYWEKKATDWGWDWAAPENKHLHPKYAPVNRYARDIIGCMNNWVDGWIDWNMVLNKQGGPNWFENWCVAPVIVDPESDEVYVTPIYYTMSHFSKFVRPGAIRIGFESSDNSLMSTAFTNPDGSSVVVLFNESGNPKNVNLKVADKSIIFSIEDKAIQTILISENNKSS